MKNKVLILWGLSILCICVTVFLWFKVNKSNPTYEEVKVTVLSSETKQVKNKKTHSTYTSYEIKVRYEGKEYDLENAHNSYSYLKGKEVTAYYANGKVFANIEGVKNDSIYGKAYFVFLIGSIILFFYSLMESAKVSQKKREELKEE